MHVWSRDIVKKRKKEKKYIYIYTVENENELKNSIDQNWETKAEKNKIK